MAGILTRLGVLDEGGQLSADARQQFINDTTTVMAAGSGAAAGFLSEDNPIGGLAWGALIGAALAAGFNIDPETGSSYSTDQHRDNFSAFHTIHVDIIFQGLANMMDIEPATPIAPVMDPAAFAEAVGLPVKEVDFDTAMDFLLSGGTNVGTYPDIIEFDPSEPPTPPVPTVPTIPSLPEMPTPGDFGLQASPPSPNIVETITAMFEAVVEVLSMAADPAFGAELVAKLTSEGITGAFDFILGLLADLWYLILLLFEFLASMVSLIAAFVVHIKNIVAMLLVAIIALVLGSGEDGGIIPSAVASFLGLI